MKAPGVRLTPLDLPCRPSKGYCNPLMVSYTRSLGRGRRAKISSGGRFWGTVRVPISETGM